MSEPKVTRNLVVGINIATGKGVGEDLYLDLSKNTDPNTSKILNDFFYKAYIKSLEFLLNNP